MLHVPSLSSSVLSGDYPNSSGTTPQTLTGAAPLSPSLYTSAMSSSRGRRPVSGSRGLFAAEPQPDSFLIAHVDGGARGNPGPAGYGVFLTDQAGHNVASLSEYLGHQTNNCAEYNGLLAALEYALAHGHKALKVVADSELLVKQIRGEYKVKSPTLLELYQRARKMIGQLEWFSIRHVLRGENQEADRLANIAMDKGMRGRNSAAASSTGEQARRSMEASAHSTSSVSPSNSGFARKEFDGVVRNGVIHLEDVTLPEGTRVQIRVRN